eukprot:1481758-Amphidinium_carterae.1
MAGDVNSAFVRKYRLGVAANKELESQLLDTVKHVFASDSLWEVFPMHTRTMHTRSLGFRVICRAAAAIHASYCWPHMRFPCRLFSLLTHPDLAEELLSVPSCLWDEMTKAFVEAFPTLSGEAFRNCLLSVALSQPIDIAKLECRHASIRRTLTYHSVQTWRLGLSMASCLWLLQCARGNSIVSLKKTNKSKTIAKVSP